MITTAEEYLRQLWLLYSENTPNKVILLPSDENIYEIDLNTRVIKTPSFLSVKKDQAAETIYFLIDRFYGEIDLATTACVIQYKNGAGQDSFYPVPFYDIVTYSSHTVSDYLEAYINSGTYEKNKYYIKEENNNYVISTGDFDENQIYYIKNDASLSNKYVVEKLTKEQYKPGIYYYYDSENKEYVLDGSNSFNEDRVYYISIDKRYIKAHVEYSNYKPNVYYILNDKNEMILATGVYNSKIEYFTLVDKPKILFPWLLTNEATAEKGVLQFSVRFYAIENSTGRLIYNLNTLPAQSKILDTLEVEISDDKFEDIKDTPSGNYYDSLGREATVLEDIYFKINAANKDIYWIEA